RVNPVAYFDIDGKIYVIGSAAGRENNPAWVHNIRANPQVSVEIGDEAAKSATAHELPRDRRDAIYRTVVERAPGFGEYQEQTDRIIPVFELVTQ
ncbi:MAG: nitroreductase family deazaflavin-dependent oxidoreductase, partial [Mycobacterium sp.]|uniref:nitroreductase family deazaflavin-dependent oxidoreductase n=1 Tax=Mycobacterium sp. TaxID=1785 RepID=UPI001EC82F7F